MRKILLIIAIFLPIALVNCGGSNSTSVTTPAPPNSPQTQVVNITKTLADAINGAVKAAVTLESQNKLSHQNTVLILEWAKSAATLDDIIGTELGSTDTWAIQKGKILTMLPMFRIPTVSGIDPSLQTTLNSITALVAQIQSQVSQ